MLRLDHQQTSVRRATTKRGCPEIYEGLDAGAMTNNQLLARLSADERLMIRSCADIAELAPGTVLVEPHVPSQYAYFLDSGIAATVLENRGGQTIEVGLTGNEGMIGLPIILGAKQCPRRTVMLVAGKVHCVPATALVGLLEALPALRSLLLAYVHTFTIQVSSTAFAGISLSVEKRLARWLLMAQDRIGSPDIGLTHGFYAVVLGVRRPGVTVALHVLEGEHLIKSTRGRTTILDRQRLEDLVGHSYGIAETEYRRLFPSLVEGATARAMHDGMAVYPE